MTRINTVPVEILSDDHLKGEYKEIPRTFTHVKKAIAKGKKPSDYKIPKEYVLGEGHVTFFYDKLDYIMYRYLSLFEEMKKRGYNANDELRDSIIQSYDSEIGDEWKGQYIPNQEAIYLNMARLCIRSKMDDVLTELSS